MKVARLFCAVIWIICLWGTLGGIAKIVTSQLSDGMIILMSVVGAVTMWLYIVSKEST